MVHEEDILHGVQSNWRVVNNTAYTIHYTLYIIHYTLYIIHYTVYSIHYTMYSLYCIRRWIEKDARQHSKFILLRDTSLRRRVNDLKTWAAIILDDVQSSPKFAVLLLTWFVTSHNWVKCIGIRRRSGRLEHPNIIHYKLYTIQYTLYTIQDTI